MLMISPVCHLHYYSLALPLIAALVADRCQQHEELTLGAWLLVLLTLNAAANLLPQLPDMNLVRDCGLSMYGNLLVWLMGVVVLVRRRGRMSAGAPALSLRWAA